MSPIHDQSYRRYAGRRRPHGQSWMIIARAGLAARLAQWRFIGLLLAAWIPFLVRVAQLYAASSFSQASFLQPTPATFRQFLDQQGLFVFFVTIAAGAGAIANDRRANALQIYLSKPITRIEYVTGKLVVLLVALLAVTWLPAMLLLLVQAILAGSVSFIRSNAFLIPAITLYSAVQVLVSSFTMLALSSLSKSHRFVGLMYAGVVLFTAALYQILRALTGSRAWAWISPGDTLDVIANAIFRVEGPAGLPVPVAFLVVAMFIGVSIWVLERRVRAVEVVT